MLFTYTACKLTWLHKVHERALTNIDVCTYLKNCMSRSHNDLQPLTCLLHMLMWINDKAARLAAHNCPRVMRLINHCIPEPDETEFLSIFQHQVTYLVKTVLVHSHFTYVLCRTKSDISDISVLKKNLFLKSKLYMFLRNEWKS